MISRPFRRPTRGTPARLHWLTCAFAAVFTPMTLLGQDTGPSPAADLSGFPGPLWAALLTVVISGAVGAFASDVATDAGRIERLRRDETGWILGFVGKMVVGSVAALILLTLNPPGESWLTLIGTSLAAGVGGEAILLAIVASRQTQQAENERDAAERNAERTARDAVEKIESFRVLATAALAGQHGEEAGRKSGPGSLKTLASEDPAPAGTTAGQARTLLDLFATRSTAEILAGARADAGGITTTIRSILVSRLNRPDVDTRKLEDLGGNDAGIRRRIAHDIAATWPGLDPPFMEEHVTAESTLDSLSRDVRRRSR